MSRDLLDDLFHAWFDEIVSLRMLLPLPGAPPGMTVGIRNMVQNIGVAVDRYRSRASRLVSDAVLTSIVAAIPIPKRFGTQVMTVEQAVRLVINVLVVEGVAASQLQTPFLFGIAEQLHSIIGRFDRIVRRTPLLARVAPGIASIVRTAALLITLNIQIAGIIVLALLLANTLRKFLNGELLLPLSQEHPRHRVTGSVYKRL